MHLPILSAAIPLPRLKASVLFNIYCSGIGLQNKICRNSWKLSRNLTESWNLKHYVGGYNCVFVEQWCIHALVIGLDGRMEFHFWFAAFSLHGSATQYFSTSPFQAVPFSVLFCNSHQMRIRNENCCMNRSSCYLFSSAKFFIKKSNLLPRRLYQQFTSMNFNNSKWFCWVSISCFICHCKIVMYKMKLKCLSESM